MYMTSRPGSEKVFIWRHVQVRESIDMTSRPGRGATFPDTEV